ncbi:uncharacterized protein [Scyliorhinus torazame]|uniref:uncharacterized protein isoform X5 n=1 Tax=Scyliorhinus torazame TaxID=75743 RepID=UPI003B5C43E1
MTSFAVLSVIGILIHCPTTFTEEAPARPTLYLQLQVPVFVRGESVELVCVAEGARRGRRFSLSRLGAEEPLQTQRAQSWSKFVVFQLREEVAIGTQVYTCSYWAWAPGSDVLSAQSETVAVTVIERAPKPTIAPEGAYRTFVEGEAVRIACTAPWALTNATFLLYQGTEDEASASATSTPGSNATTFDTGGGAGVGRRDYSCAYVTEVSERRIESQRSETVRIRVESRLTKPNLYLDGVNITFQVGDTVRLVCEGGIEDWLNTFLLYQGVAEEPLMSGKPIFARAAVTFDVTDALAHGTETFSCASRRDLSGRRVLSQRSDMLEVSAHEQPTLIPGRRNDHGPMAGDFSVDCLSLIIPELEERAPLSIELMYHPTWRSNSIQPCYTGTGGDPFSPLLESVTQEQ